MKETTAGARGLALSRRYYEEVGRPALLRAVPEAEGVLAAGLVGHGSECFGFDDALSADHDYGPGFCVWLTGEAYARFGARLRECYASLPGSFDGVPARRPSLQGGGRVGVFEIGDFYESLTGVRDVPVRSADWYALAEPALAAATNGAVFEDRAGEMTRIREGFLAYYPEEVRRRRLAQALALAAQAGQYNYSRLMRRGEAVGAALAERLFLEQAMQAAYLLERRYAPFYKWMRRGMDAFAALRSLPALFDQLAESAPQRGAWEADAAQMYGGLNLADEKVVCMETICGEIVRELHRQGLSDVQDNYLEAHAQAILRENGGRT